MRSQKKSPNNYLNESSFDESQSNSKIVDIPKSNSNKETASKIVDEAKKSELQLNEFLHKPTRQKVISILSR